jgi:hypothetical protein
VTTGTRQPRPIRPPGATSRREDKGRGSTCPNHLGDWLRLLSVKGSPWSTFPQQHEPAQVRHVRPGKVVIERGPLSDRSQMARVPAQRLPMSNQLSDGPLVPCQATFALLTISLRRRSRVLRFRQAM